MTEIIHLNSENFEQVVESTDGQLLVDFWASWCGPCRLMGTVLEELAEMDKPGLTIAKVDVDSEPELAERFDISAIPALRVFRDGEMVAEQNGAVPVSHLLGLLGME